MVTLAIFGGLAEYREEWKLYGVWILAIALFANLLSPLVAGAIFPGFASGVGIGASGITYALAGRELSYRTLELGEWSRPLRTGGILVLSAVFVAADILLILAGEAAWISHTVGLILGLATGFAEHRPSWGE